jgi:hypothetical protein
LCACHRLKNELRADLNRGLQASINRAPVGEKAVDPDCRLALRFFGLEPEPHVNPLDDQDIIFEFDLAGRLRDQPRIRRIDLTRLQRASKGSGQSTGGGRDYIVQSRGVRFQDIRWNLVVFGDRAVNTEDHGL